MVSGGFPSQHLILAIANNRYHQELSKALMKNEDRKNRLYSICKPLLSLPKHTKPKEVEAPIEKRKPRKC